MKVILGGLSRDSDTLTVETLEHVKWQDISAILNIPGVQYYYAQSGSIGVRYSKLVDAKDVAAAVLKVLATVHHVSAWELSIVVDTFLIGDIDAIGIADEVWRRACVCTTPEAPAAASIEPRGTGPAYWLRS